MIINVGSTNPVKIEAVRETLVLYPRIFEDFKIRPIDVTSGVSEQPKSLEETIEGAMNRAKKAVGYCDYSFGLESGLMEVPFTKTGSMEFCSCVIYNGKNYALGLSSAFEFPIKVTQMIHDQGIDANEAFYKCGLTENPKMGSSEGAIGMLTNGKVTRKDYTKQAIQMALIHLEHKELY